MPSQTTPLCNWHYFTCCIPDQHCSALQWRGSARAMLLTLVTLLPTREEVCGGNEATICASLCAAAAVVIASLSALCIPSIRSATPVSLPLSGGGGGSGSRLLCAGTSHFLPPLR